MDFSSLELHPDLQRGIAEAAYVTCTPVQEQVIAQAASGRDLYVQSQTGTGKTAAFLVVIFQRLLTDPPLKGRKALIMVPTRELAVQVEEEAQILGRYLPFTIGSFYGGVGYGAQQKLLRNDCDVLVGTPGRVLDLNSGGEMNLMEIAFLIIDEADRMFDMGFYPDLRRLISVVPPPDKRQTMLFSATLNNYVKNLAWEYTREPLEIEIESEHVTVDEIEQVLYHVHSADKMRLLLGIFEREKPESALIFCNTKRYTEVVAQRLRRNGIQCEFISGDLPQMKRLALIEDLKSGKNSILVATDVAARGLDIEGLALVVNYDLPIDAENYVHRIGRTARAGKTGKAISLASEQDVYELSDIEKYIAAKIPSEVADESLLVKDKSGGAFSGERGDRAGRRGAFSGERDRGGRGDRGGGDRGERSGPREDRERGGRNDRLRGRAEHSERRSQGPIPEGERRPQEKRGEGRRSDGQGRRDERAGHEREGRSLPKVNLSQMTLEERMAYYNEKYGDAPKSAETRTAGAQSVRGEQDARNPRSAREPGKGRGKGRNRRRGPEQQGREQQGRKDGSTISGRNVSKKPDSGAAPANTRVKKGLFSKLAALFKGKKD
ncbi:MAG: DEAD/DEAH box helicase [Spirochaetaceae bacterium]|jgi:ATP-dependent RNA helicase RhlB|nr:DEAD/DEAH box helicase [Spirochaetaceae bacterium]